MVKDLAHIQKYVRGLCYLSSVPRKSLPDGWRAMHILKGHLGHHTYTWFCD